MVSVPRRVLEDWLFEDVGRGDLTTRLLGIEGVEGRAEVYVREECVVACSEEAAEVYRIAGAEARVLKPSGADAKPGDIVVEAWGPAGALHAAWRVAQTLLAVCSGVATKTRRMVEKARRVNPRIAILSTRKTPPGLRAVLHKAVIAGGGLPHRAGLDDSILVFDNHLVFLEGGLREAVERLSKGVGVARVWGVEVRSLEEALMAAKAGAGFIQFEKVPPDKLREYVEVLRREAPGVRVGAAGGIDEHNVEDYAATGIDFIVTSAVYHAKPIDVGTRMSRLGRER